MFASRTSQGLTPTHLRPSDFKRSQAMDGRGRQVFLDRHRSLRPRPQVETGCRLWVDDPTAGARKVFFGLLLVSYPHLRKAFARDKFPVHSAFNVLSESFHLRAAWSGGCRCFRFALRGWSNLGVSGSSICSRASLLW